MISGNGPANIHASAVSIKGRGVLIRGAAGSGKTTLALDLIEDPLSRAVLVSDDQTLIRSDGKAVFASAPGAIAGQAEIRGVGIIGLPQAGETPVALVVDLLPAAECVRLPGPDERMTRLLGHILPRLTFAIGANGGARAVRFALSEWDSGV